MRKWNAPDDLELLNRAVAGLRDTRRLEPGTITADDPVDLRGMSFPTVTLCEELELPTVVVSLLLAARSFRTPLFAG